MRFLPWSVTAPASFCYQIGKPKTDLRNKSDQQQRNDHAQIEWQGCFHYLLYRKLCHSRTDKKNTSDRRSKKSDSAVQDYHDSKLNRIDTDRNGNGKKDRRRDQDDRSHVHDTAKDQHDGKGIHTITQNTPHALPVQSFVDKYTDDQAVDNRDRGRFRYGKDTAYSGYEYNGSKS